MNDRLLDVPQAAAHLAISPKTIYKWVHLRRIPYVRVGRLVRFRVSDLDDWIEERIQPDSTGVSRPGGAR